MATARFESYVQDRVRELSAERRKRLEDAVKAEEAKVEKQQEKYLKMVEDGVEALVRSVVAKARKDGLPASDRAETGNIISEYAKDRVRAVLGLRLEYDCDLRTSLWPVGTEARRAQDALRRFDEFCDREARKIVVYKMDLGMKPEAFERMLAEAAERINKE